MTGAIEIRYFDDPVDNMAIAILDRSLDPSTIASNGTRFGMNGLDDLFFDHKFFGTALCLVIANFTDVKC